MDSALASFSDPLTTEAYVCGGENQHLQYGTITLPPLSATQIQVEVLMIGLCHSDIHMRDNDWGISDYPLVLGHEGICQVTQIGSSVNNVSVGDRVGIAWIRDSCSACEACLVGRENICEKGYQGTYLGESAGANGKGKYNSMGGCFSRIQRIEEKFAVRIPDVIPTEIACPLLCGGGTMYEPLCNYAKVGQKIGVVGMGGLGTVGVKLAKIRGCVVVAISGSEGKREALLSCGADEFVCTKNEEEMKSIEHRLDVVLDTTPVGWDTNVLMKYVKRGGVICKLGIPQQSEGSFDCNVYNLIFSQVQVAGSAVIGTRRLNEMMRLVADNFEFMKDSDSWHVEVIGIDRVNEAMEELKTGANRGYRYVLKW